MSFDNTKYDLEINSTPYRVKGYSRSELQAFIPRVGSGEQSETEFNLLRSKTIKGFNGGMLQRYMEDNSTVFAVEGAYPIYDDGTLYPINDFVDPSGTTALIGKSIMTAWVQTADYLYIAYKNYSTQLNSVKRIDKSGTQVAMTVPANISSTARSIISMVVYGTEIWLNAVDTAGAGTTGRFDVSSTTISEITTGANCFYKMAVFKGQLYGTYAALNARHSILYKYTGTTTSFAAVEVGRVPNTQSSTSGELFVYSGRLWQTRNDGMFAFDGISLLPVEDLSTQINTENYRFPRVLKGFLYYFMPDGMYRFNGSLIEKLYDTAEIGYPVDVCTGKNRLWIAYANGRWSGSSRYDKAMGYDYSAVDSVDGRVAVFNGKSLYTYDRISTFVKNPATIDFATQEDVTGLMFFNDTVYVTLNHSKNGSYYTVSTNEKALTGSHSWRIVTSIDDEFPMIDKTLENLELIFDGNVSADEDILVEYRTAGFDGSTGWTTLTTLKSQTAAKKAIWQSIAGGLVYKRIQFRFSGTTASAYGISRIVMRNMLSPDMKWQWNFTVLCYGDDPTAPLALADGTSSTQTVRDLRGNIYAARSSDVPVKLVDWDQLDLNGAHNNSVTTITVNSTALLRGETGLVQIDDEILSYTAKTATTLTVVRGVLGTAAASHADNAKVFPVYRTVVRQIQQERFISADDGRRTLEDKDLPTEITLVIQEV